MGKVLVIDNCILIECYMTFLENHHGGKINWVSEIHKLITDKIY